MTPALVPVTVLTGALGSGKTTLLRHLLHNDKGIRIAVVENEFGDERGIERLIALGDGQDSKAVLSDDLFVELSNGCVCCGVRDSLVETLEALVARRSRFDHIVIETSGLANPGPVAGIFWGDAEMEGSLMLDGIVCMVDLVNFEHHALVEQVAYADRIVFNKRDSVNDEQFNKIVALINKVNPWASTTTTSFGKVDFDFALNVGALQKSNLIKLLSREEPMSHGHSDQISSIVLRESARPVPDLFRLREWLGVALWEPPSGLEVFRVKGIAWLAGDERAHVVQGVHKIFDIEPWTDWALTKEPARLTKIVLIGNGVQQHKQWLTEGFEKVLA